jgi:PAS domain-containing protein
MSAVEAGTYLGLPADVVRALSDAGYLPSVLRGGVPRFALGDLKAFQARAAEAADPDADPDDVELDDAGDLDPDVIIGLLTGRVGDMAERTLRVLQAAMPAAQSWGPVEQAELVRETADRIDAILAMCAEGPTADDESTVSGDLAGIGADAAGSGLPLAGVLLELRTSRDLLVQTAIEVAEEHGRRWGLALAVALTKVIPAIDRLSDAVARGYWEATLAGLAGDAERYRAIVDDLDVGVAVTDPEGVVVHANAALVAMLATSTDDAVGRPLDDVVGVAPGVDAVVGDLDVRQRQRGPVGWDVVVTRVRAEQVHGGGEDPAAAAGVVDRGHGLVDEAGGDRPERLGGGTLAEDDGVAGVAAEGDGGLEGDLPEQG